MDVRSEGPHEVGSLVFLAPDGSWTLTVIAKATFRLAPDVSPVLPEGGDPVLVEDVHWDGDPGASLRACSDLVPFKQSAEVLVTGSAYAPGGKAVRAAAARVTIGTVDKAVEVQGDRYFDREGRLSAAAPWTRMPLVWERAAGGLETINPVGIPMGRTAITDARGRVFLPNLWPSWTSIASPDDTFAPACFGPLSADWPERTRRLHPGLAWERPLPADFDGAYFNASPEDQRLSDLTGAETLVLENLHPHHARLVTRLAPAAPIAVLEAPGQGQTHFAIDLACDTLWIDTDRGLATLTFRAHVTIDEPAMPGTFVVRAREVPAGRAPMVSMFEIAMPPAPSGGRQETVELAGLPMPVSAHGRHQTAEIAVPSVPLPPGWGPSPAEVPSPPAEVPVTLAQALHAKIALRPEIAAVERPKEEPFVPLPTEANEPVAPPPLWSGVEADEDTEEPTDHGPIPVLPEPPPPPPGPPPLPLEDYPLARCAALAASLDVHPNETGKILTKASLDEEMWERLAAHWDEAVEKELRRHRNKLLRDYDSAYVTRLEEERGPVVAADYARIAAAAEVNEAGPVLEDLRIPAAAWPRVRRVWIANLAKDRKLAALVQSFLEDERSRPGP